MKKKVGPSKKPKKPKRRRLPPPPPEPVLIPEWASALCDEWMSCSLLLNVTNGFGNPLSEIIASMAWELRIRAGGTAAAMPRPVLC